MAPRAGRPEIRYTSIEDDIVDFGDILDEWERIKREHKDSSPSPETRKAAAREAPAAPKAGGALEAWLAKNGIKDKDAEAGEGRNGAERGLESRRLAALRPQAVLDLHGMTGEEAEAAIADFVSSSSRRGLEKVLVIHGKGLHSSGAPVLKKAARRALESLPLAGRFGEADKIDGGSGALWVLIRSAH
jgi:DNA-nicking Smr family endonuclease